MATVIFRVAVTALVYFLYWAAEKNTAHKKMSADDKRAILIFLGSTGAFVAGLMLVGRYLHYLY